MICVPWPEYNGLRFPFNAYFQIEPWTQLTAFYTHPATAMRPNLDYGQVIRGRNYLPWQGRAEGVIDVRAWAYLPTVLAVLDLYPPSPA